MTAWQHVTLFVWRTASSLKVVLYLIDHTNQRDGGRETVFFEAGMKRAII